MSPTRAGKALGVFRLHAIDESEFADMVSLSLRGMNGVDSVAVNYVTDKVYVSYDPTKTSPGRIRRAIVDADLRARGTPG